MSGTRVDVYVVDLLDATDQAEVDRLASVTLSSDEQDRASKFRFSRDAHRYVMTHLLKRHVLATYTRTSPASLSFGIGQYGKPHLTGWGGDLYFNLSHSGRYGCIAVCDGDEVGVDVQERCEIPLTPAFLATVLSDAERSSLAEAADPYVSFFRTWTVKEAVLKASGAGMSCKMSSLNVQFSDQDDRSRAQSAFPWNVATCDFPHDHSFAVAVRYRPFVVKIANWSIGKCFSGFETNSLNSQQAHIYSPAFPD